MLAMPAMAQSTPTSAPKNECKRDTVLLSQSREGNTLVSHYVARCATQQTATVAVHFALDVSTLSPSFGDNASAMATLNKWLHASDTTIHIKSIAIHGYASPDGEVQKNVALAQARTTAMADYIRKQHPGANPTLTSTACKWNDCVSAVRQSAISNNQDVLKIQTANESEPQKEQQLHHFADAWKSLTHDILPTMRCVEVTFVYCTDNYFTTRKQLPAPKPVETKQPTQPKPQPIAIIEEEDTGIIIEMQRGEKEHHKKKQERKAHKRASKRASK